MAMIQKTLNVDDEVAAVCDTLVVIAQDIKAKKAIGQELGDVMNGMAAGLNDLANLSADVKAHPDNAKYIFCALTGVVQVFVA